MARLRQRYLLFIDLLGAKSRWHRAGRAVAEVAYRQLRSLVESGLSTIDDRELIDGLIETDAAAIVCTSTEACVKMGLEVFRNAFSLTGAEPEQRPWLRGTITPLPQYTSLRSAASVPTPYRKIKISSLTSGLLDAISVEKSGFKGMRLLITAALITRPLLAGFAIPVGPRSLAPFKTLKHSYYPARLGKDFEDVFWMIRDSGTSWEQAKRTMALRLRLAARDPEEFVQAAATQVLFHECSAIIWNLSRTTGVNALKDTMLADVPDTPEGADG